MFSSTLRSIDALPFASMSWSSSMQIGRRKELAPTCPSLTWGLLPHIRLVKGTCSTISIDPIGQPTSNSPPSNSRSTNWITVPDILSSHRWASMTYRIRARSTPSKMKSSSRKVVCLRMSRAGNLCRMMFDRMHHWGQVTLWEIIVRLKNDFKYFFTFNYNITLKSLKI